MDLIKSIFGFEGVGQSALKIVDKIAGTDWTAKEKAQFVLDHAAATKYQSPTRRVIAIMLLVEWSLLVTTWLASRCYGRLVDSSSALMLADDVSLFMNQNVNVAFSGVLAFYFLIGMKK